MEKVLNFGELLLRVCPDADGTWLNESRLPVYVGGAELNVAAALALWKLPSVYFTALPDHLLSHQIVAHLEGLSIVTSSIMYTGERVGIYYLHQGKDLKNAGVIYDRAGSSFSGLRKEDIDWNQLFAGITWFHFSAICPALSQNVADLCEEALKQASLRKIRISVDLNYRAKLWKYGKSPAEVMPLLVAYCDVVMGNVWAAETMLNIPVAEDLTHGASQLAYLDQARETSDQIRRQFPNCSVVANTFRFDADQGVHYYSTLATATEFYTSKQYKAGNILDKVGSGDCYMAGLIYGFCTAQRPMEVLEFATAAAFTKLFVGSDATTLSIQEIKEMAEKYEN